MAKWRDPREQPYRPMDVGWLQEVACIVAGGVRVVGVGKRLEGGWLVTTKWRNQYLVTEEQVVAYRQYEPPKWPEDV